MSGGVDSSVAAYLLQKEGYEVLGIFMKNWEELDENGRCLALQDYEDVIKVCDILHIPHTVFNFVEEYHQRVFHHFLRGYELGQTPNPDIVCNREIKFGLFLKKALELGVDYIATGHYAQIHPTSAITELHKGADENKDQSYFLYTLKESILQKTLFPIGHLPKPTVKKIAYEQHFSTYNKKESMGICFIGKKNFAPFLSSYLDKKEGLIMDIEGNVLQKHKGLFLYTIGQRKGLQIGGKGDAWYVVDKDVHNNIVYVAQGKNHPSLFASHLMADDITWINNPPSFPLSCHAKIRYRQKEVPCLVTPGENKEQLQVTFDSPQRAITPMQSIVFYHQNRCLGGGIISKRIVN